MKKANDRLSIFNETKSISHLLINEEDEAISWGINHETVILGPTENGCDRYGYGDEYTISITLKRTK